MDETKSDESPGRIAGKPTAGTPPLDTGDGGAGRADSGRAIGGKRARTRGHDGAMETAFGFEGVGSGEEKQGRVNGVFASVARRYDVMNDLMSAGLHRAWKNALVTKLNPSTRREQRFLDMAGGTGDIAFRIMDRSRGRARVVVGDISAQMLAVGEERAVRRGEGERVRFDEVNAESLPYEDASFDGYTIAVGIRNVPRIDRALAEAYRVLRPGGRFVCLEFSEVDVPGLDRLYDAWSFGAIPRIGRLVTGDADSYRYLVESIRRFPAPDDFAAMIGVAGFERVSFERLTGGIVALHVGWKL